MPDFDPDAYLDGGGTATAPAADFNPDEYLNAQPAFDPNAYLGIKPTPPPTLTPASDAVVAATDTAITYGSSGPTTAEAVGMEKAFKVAHPSLYGVARGVAGMIPTPEQIVQAGEEVNKASEHPIASLAALPGEIVNNATEMGKAARGDYGPEAQAQTITGAVLTAAPLLHLPFAKGVDLAREAPPVQTRVVEPAEAMRPPPTAEPVPAAPEAVTGTPEGAPVTETTMPAAAEQPPTVAEPAPAAPAGEAKAAVKNILDQYESGDQKISTGEDIAKALSDIEGLPPSLQKAVTDFNEALRVDREEYGQRSGLPEDAENVLMGEVRKYAGTTKEAPAAAPTEATATEPDFSHITDQQTLSREAGGMIMKAKTTAEMQAVQRALKKRAAELQAPPRVAEPPHGGEVATPPVKPNDKVYDNLLGRGKAVGPNLYELTEKQVTPALRKKLDVRGRPEETDSFSLRPKADVTGNPYDRGWILKDKRPDFARRATQPRVTEPPQGGISKVVYHGSKEESPQFQVKSMGNDIGIHFGTAEQADWRVGDEGTVKPYRIEIKNPLRLDDPGGWYGESAVAEINKKIGSNLSPSASVGKIRDAIQKAGYDGVVYKNKFEHPLESPDEDSYIVFNKDQIKAAEPPRVAEPPQGGGEPPVPPPQEPAKPPPSGVSQGETPSLPPGQTGASAKSFEDVYGKGEIPTGQSVLPEEIYAQGAADLANGADVYAYADRARVGNVTPRELGQLAAEHNRLVTEAAALEGSLAYEPAYQRARAFAENMLKPAGTRWHQTGMGLQVKAPIDYSNLTGFRQAVEENMKREMTPSETRNFKQVARDVNKAKTAAAAEGPRTGRKIAERYRGVKDISFDDAVAQMRDAIQKGVTECGL